MTRKLRWLALGAVVVLVAGLALGLVLAFTGGSSAPKHAQPRTAVDWQQLWAATQEGEKESDALARWPVNPYQQYTDGQQDECYEWRGDNLYNLCFKDGVLRSKAVF